MKSKKVVAEKKLYESKYPYLGVFDDPEDQESKGEFVVLFTSQGTGVVVQSDDKSVWDVGDYHADWSDNFSYYKGGVLLEND